MLTPAEHIKLEELCHLHSTCVRDERAAACPATETEKLLRQSRADSMVHDSADLWFTGLPVFAHLSRLMMPRPSLLLVAVGVMFVVAVDISREHHEALCCSLWVETIRRRRREAEESTEEGDGKCCGSLHISLPKMLNLLRREVLVPAVPICTVLAIISSQTSFNIILNGFVSVVILQMDSQVCLLSLLSAPVTPKTLSLLSLYPPSLFHCTTVSTYPHTPKGFLHPVHGAPVSCDEGGLSSCFGARGRKSS